MDLTQASVREILHYNPVSCDFYWKPRAKHLFADNRAALTWNKKYPGKKAGSPDNKGYLRINIGGKKFKSHRLAWLYVHGYWPDVIDHINGVKDDNRISNLRSVSFKENMKNMPLKSSSSTGVTGVEARKEHGFYVASITVDGKRKYLGSFKLLDDAKQARKEANALYGFHENHGRSQ
ncbi:HNH endonuclease [Salmonella enterica]|nr:HNH endonuclease [Salmonella enterica]